MEQKPQQFECPACGEQPFADRPLGMRDAHLEMLGDEAPGIAALMLATDRGVVSLLLNGKGVTLLREALNNFRPTM